MNAAQPEVAPRASSRWKLLLILGVCAAPMVAALAAYYLVQPQMRSNYGELIVPQRPIPALVLRRLDGRPFEVSALEGRWLMVMVAGGTCVDPCREELYHIRQVRLTMGAERERVVRVWLIPDNESLSAELVAQYEGTLALRANRAELESWLPATPSSHITDHIYIVDPLGHLMMRFPVNADPNRTKRDLSKLLAASSIG